MPTWIPRDVTRASTDTARGGRIDGLPETADTGVGGNCGHSPYGKESTMRKPSPAMIVALLALFVALGGVGVAATGGNFILGQSNTATANTSLSSAVVGGKALQLTNNDASNA